MRIATTAKMNAGRVIETSDKKFEFITGWNHHKNGFVHYCIIYDYATSKEVASAKVCYINRTWEAYPYRTAMRCAASKISSFYDRNELLAKL